MNAHPTRSPASRSGRLVAFGAAVLAAALALAVAGSSGADEAKQQAYGRHLAQECTSCHRIDGIDNGIPSIIGWGPAEFVNTLKFYREGKRTNPVMVSVAGSLSDEQMAALASYFSALPKPAPKAKAPADRK